MLGSKLCLMDLLTWIAKVEKPGFLIERCLLQNMWPHRGEKTTHHVSRKKTVIMLWYL